jgi:hypothetical protein
MPTHPFQQRFIDFCEYNRQRRVLELGGESDSNIEIPRGWHEALTSLTACYGQAWERELIVKVLADPYFPLSKLRKLNLEEFATEPGFIDLPEESLARIAAEVLLNWAGIFLHIRQDLAILGTNGEVSSIKLSGSPQECLPKSSWCDYCGGCCEIRGGPAEFTGGFEPPERWVGYFRGDACEHQRFCPFLFEYFTTAKFFCSIYRVKPKCCWAFDSDECDFLQRDVVRERAARYREEAD